MTIVEDNDRSPELKIELKHSKCYAGKSEIISVRETKDSLCPVKAFRKFRARTHRQPRDLPAYCGSHRKPLTKAVFAKTLRALLKPALGPMALKLSCHSFRAGIPSILAKK